MSGILCTLLRTGITVLHIVGGCALGFALGLGSPNTATVLFDAVREAVPRSERSRLYERFESALGAVKRTRSRWLWRAAWMLGASVAADVILGVFAEQ